MGNLLLLFYPMSKGGHWAEITIILMGIEKNVRPFTNPGIYFI